MKPRLEKKGKNKKQKQKTQANKKVQKMSKSIIELPLKCKKVMETRVLERYVPDYFFLRSVSLMVGIEKTGTS